MNRINNKVAIITGATSVGIGRETALKLSSEGALLTVTGRNEEEGKKTADMVIRQGGKCIYLKHDVANEENWKEVIQETVNSFGSIDYLVNNAGQFWIKPISETSLADFKQICSAIIGEYRTSVFFRNQRVKLSMSIPTIIRFVHNYRKPE